MKRSKPNAGISTKTRSEQREQRRQRIIQISVSIFLVLLLLFSYVAYYFTPDDTVIRENGFKITPAVDSMGYISGYSTKVQGVVRTFYTAPGDSMDVALPAGMIDELHSAPLVIVLFDPTDPLTPIFDQIRFDLSTNLNATILPAVTQTTDRYQFITLSCENATPGTTTLFLGSGNRSITRDDGCYSIRGAQGDFGALRDRVLYRYHGITTS